MSQNPYLEYAQSFRRLHVEGRSLPFGGMPKPEKTELAEDAPVALILSPHPDDECVIGGLALRLMRESGVRIVNVAVTLGSNRERQAERLDDVAELFPNIEPVMEIVNFMRIDSNRAICQPLLEDAA